MSKITFVDLRAIGANMARFKHLLLKAQVTRSGSHGTEATMTPAIIAIDSEVELVVRWF